MYDQLIRFRKHILILPADWQGPDVTLLDPAGGALTFPAEALKLAVQEYTDKYGNTRSHSNTNFVGSFARRMPGSSSASSKYG